MNYAEQVKVIWQYCKRGMLFVCLWILLSGIFIFFSNPYSDGLSEIFLALVASMLIAYLYKKHFLKRADHF